MVRTIFCVTLADTDLLKANDIEALTPEERRHAMGNSGDVYERYYMPSFIDADY
jgi:hypothetical protein